MGRSVGYGQQWDYEECDYGQECLLWIGVSVMSSNVITRSVIMGRSVCYRQECRVWAGV